MAHIEEMWAEGTVEQELFDGIYTDTNEVGDVFPWGAKFVYPSSFQAQPLHFVPPWGYGCTAFKLGSCEATLTRLVQAPSLLADTVSAVLSHV